MGETGCRVSPNTVPVLRSGCGNRLSIGHTSGQPLPAPTAPSRPVRPVEPEPAGRRHGDPGRGRRGWIRKGGIHRPGQAVRLGANLLARVDPATGRRCARAGVGHRDANAQIAMTRAPTCVVLRAMLFATGLITTVDNRSLPMTGQPINADRPPTAEAPEHARKPRVSGALGPWSVEADRRRPVL
jgi:hypothetical protein